MIHAVGNMSGKNPASVIVRSTSVLVLLTLMLFASGGLGPIHAADKGSELSLFPSSTTQITKDVELETRILRTLRQDGELGPLNLGVHVRGGVAKLSGPVPTAELKQRAIRILRHVDGVLTVSAGDLYISSSAKGRKRVAIVIQDDLPTQTRAASPPVPGGGNGIAAQADSPLLAPQKSVHQAAGPGTERQVTLLAPEMIAPPGHGPEPARLTGNPRSASPGASLAAAIEQLRRREIRYQQIRARVQGTTVYILPGETAGEDAMTFAQAVRRLPGVQHVILDSNSR